MRKTLCLVSLGCCLVLALACNQSASSPTQPAVSSAPTLQVVTGQSASKVLLCHRNSSEDPFGVTTLVKSNDKTHWKHLASDQDCIDTCGYEPGTPCDPYSGGDDYCDECQF